MSFRFLRYCLWFLAYGSACAQFNRPDTLSHTGLYYQAELSGWAAQRSQTPFWLRTNQFGALPWASPGALFNGSLGGRWQVGNWTLKASVQAVGQLTRSPQVVLPQAYVGLERGHVELYVGRRREINGLTDTLLTSGSYAYSGNAVPITQIRLGTREYAPLGFTKGWVAINAFMSHGWFTDTDSMKNVWLHGKALFVRLGKQKWHLYGGVTHFVQWGGYSAYLEPGLTRNGHLPRNWTAFKNVLWPGSLEGNANDQLTGHDTLNRVGNQLGSIDLGLELNLRSFQLLVYHQHAYEDMSGVAFQNFPDGIFGLRWKTTTPSKAFQLRQLTLEYITTLNRSGRGPKGYDDYFYNGQYLDGWVHENYIIGTPLFTRTKDIPYALRQTYSDLNRPRSVNNNALRAWHVGLEAQVLVPIQVLLTRTTYVDDPFRSDPHRFRQFSMSVALPAIPLGRGLFAGVKLALDRGDLFSQNAGLLFSLRKVGGWGHP